MMSCLSVIETYRLLSDTDACLIHLTSRSHRIHNYPIVCHIALLCLILIEREIPRRMTMLVNNSVNRYIITLI